MAVTIPNAPASRPGQTASYNTFTGGFVTEATGLSYPENTARDIENCDIALSGKVRRRLGLDVEPNGLSRTAEDLESTESHACSVWEWNAVAGNPSLNLYVVQMGTKLFLYNQDVEPVSTYNSAVTQLANNLIELDTSSLIWGDSELDWASGLIQGCSGAGRFWITWPYDEPMYLEYDIDTQTVTRKYVGTSSRYPSGRITVRDFVGFDLPNDPTSDGTVALGTPQAALATWKYRYNLVNAGWPDDAAIATWGSTLPPLNSVYFTGKDGNGDWTKAQLIKTTFGQEAAPQGRLMYHPLRGLRHYRNAAGTGNWTYFGEGVGGAYGGGGTVDYAVTGSDPMANSSLSDIVPIRSFTACGFFASRLWMAGDVGGVRPGGLFFSKVIERAEDAGFCAQVNDPTSEDFPDLLDTDGGVIYLSEASGIVRLVPAGLGLLVFANNGVWFVRGGENGFNANQYSVDKVSSVGTPSPMSVVNFEDQVTYWGTGGIYSIQFQGGLAVASQAITDTTIRKYFQAIPLEAKGQSFGFADEFGKRMMWMWKDESPYPDVSQRQSYRNKVLILDLRLGSFTKYTIPFDEVNNVYPMVGFARKSVTFPQQPDPLVTTLGDEITNNASQVYVTFEDIVAPQLDLQSNVYIVTQVGFATNQADIYMFEFGSLSFTDFNSVSAVNYDSYLDTAPQHFGDLARNKMATYVHSFFHKTEGGFELGDGGYLEADFPSKCTIQGRWDWHITDSGGRWSNEQQAYKIRRPYTPVDADDTFDTGEEVVYTKRKIRGKGKALGLRYASVEGFDFQLAGFSIDVTGNSA